MVIMCRYILGESKKGKFLTNTFHFVEISVGSMFPVSPKHTMEEAVDF